jgi:hypothetical protein
MNALDRPQRRRRGRVWREQPSRRSVLVVDDAGTVVPA